MILRDTFHQVDIHDAVSGHHPQPSILSDSGILHKKVIAEVKPELSREISPPTNRFCQVVQSCFQTWLLLSIVWCTVHHFTLQHCTALCTAPSTAPCTAPCSAPATQHCTLHCSCQPALLQITAAATEACSGRQLQTPGRPCQSGEVW